jgi:hypothetical protein
MKKIDANSNGVYLIIRSIILLKKLQVLGNASFNFMKLVTELCKVFSAALYNN